MFNSLVNNMLLTPVSKLKIAATSFILGAAFLGLGAVSGNAQEIKDGDHVNLVNKYKEVKNPYLDTKGRVIDVPDFKNISETVFVFTSDKTNRDKGSGTWMIRSVDSYMKNYKQGDGTTIKYDDKVYLINSYPNAGFLDAWDGVIDFFGGKTNSGADKDNRAVFTSARRDRNNKSSQWIVSSRNKNAIGTPVKANDNILLESVNNPGYYLETSGVVNINQFPYLNHINDKNGFLHLIWITKTGIHADSDLWQIKLSPDVK